MNYPTDKTILALDPAQKMGWALLSSGVVTSGTAEFKRRTGRKRIPDEHLGKAFYDLHKWLRGMIVDKEPDCIVYEDVMRFTSSSDSKSYGAIRGLILVNAAARNIPVCHFAVPSIKKFATGKGNAKKDMMIASAIEKYPDQDVLDDNQADALHILHYFLCGSNSPS